MHRNIIGLILLCTFANVAFSQDEFGPWVSIYSDITTQLEIQYHISDEACENTGIQNYFRYKILGGKKNGNSYITFKIGYNDCNNNSKFQEYSIDIGESSKERINIAKQKLDWKFEGTLVDQFYDVALSSTYKQSSGSRIQVYSKDPQFIEGNINSFYGDPVELTVKGGQLGDGASWFWYENACDGRSLGRGKSIVVYPKINSTYFVRAEGLNNITNCAELSINVDMNSVSPTNIIGSDKICLGTNTTLTVTGGRLGPDANWIWYSGECNGKSIGRGNSITIRPTSSESYFVRAEGPFNTTACTEKLIAIFDNSKPPDSIFSLSSKTVCEGEKLIMEVYGGKLSTDGKWKWYSNSKFENPIASGIVITVYPSSTTSYYVRGEGMCNNTIAVSLTIYVNKKSVKPYSINSSSAYNVRGEKITLSLANGNLGEDAHWEWYKETRNSKNKIGEGYDLSVRDWKSNTYFVKAVGLCNETDYISFYNTPQKSHFLDKIYAKKDNKFLGLGTGIGVEYINFCVNSYFNTVNSDGSIINSDSNNIAINCLGLKGELSIYPYIKDYLSLGMIGNYSIGISPLDIAAGGVHKNDLVTKESLLYTKLSLTGELSFGFKMSKLLLKLNRSFQPIDFIKTVYSNSSGNTCLLYTSDAADE